METLTFNDGTVITGHCLESDGILFMYMYSVTLIQAFGVLSVPAKTNKIKEIRNGQETNYTGYNHLFSIREESGMITAALKHQ